MGCRTEPRDCHSQWTGKAREKDAATRLKISTHPLQVDTWVTVRLQAASAESVAISMIRTSTPSWATAPARACRWDDVRDVTSVVEIDATAYDVVTNAQPPWHRYCWRWRSSAHDRPGDTLLTTAGCARAFARLSLQKSWAASAWRVQLCRDLVRPQPCGASSTAGPPEPSGRAHGGRQVHLPSAGGKGGKPHVFKREGKCLPIKSQKVEIADPGSDPRWFDARFCSNL